MKKNRIDSIWKPPPKDWMKININASMWLYKVSFYGYFMRDNHATIIITGSKAVGDSSILMKRMFGCMWSNNDGAQKNIQRIIIESDFQLVVNFINDKICVHKNVRNLVKDTKNSFFRDIRIEYCMRNSRYWVSHALYMFVAIHMASSNDISLGQESTTH